MKIETTSVVGLMTKQIKNNPSIYASKTGFKIFLNGEFILQYESEIPKPEIEVMKFAKETLEELKFGTFFNAEIQKRFDEFIRP